MPKLMQHDYGNIQHMLDVAEDSIEWFNKQLRAFAAATGGRVHHGGAATKRAKFQHEQKDKKANGAAWPSRARA